MKEHGICAKCKKSVGCPYADDRIKGCKKFVLEDELELTNEEYIKSLNTEQLADFLNDCRFYFDGLKIVSAKYQDMEIEDIPLEWLKQPHIKE